MRIDYSEPRQSSGSSSSSISSSPRKAESSSSTSLLFLCVLAGFIFFTGFGTGWFFSQKAAKKAFRAAMEQQSLESTPKDTKKQPDQPAQQPPQAAATPPTAIPTAGKPAQQAAPTGQVPLSFFESLPKGQKQTVLGSGINEKPKSATTPVPQAPQAPASAAKAPDTKAASSGFLVQVAAFTNIKEAENTKAKLAAKGYSASISEINLNYKGTWYRVRIGRHLDKEAASEIASRVGSGAKVLPDQE
jgi:cell division protein FtsN